MAYKLDGKKLPLNTPFSSNGINYPANWLTQTTLDEKKAIGITEVADPAWYDQRFYSAEGVAKKLVDEDVKDESGNLLKNPDGSQRVDIGLKTSFLNKTRDDAKGLLNKYDWYVTRKAEKGTAIPSAVTTYRDAIRTTCATRETEINNCSDVAALKTLIDGTYDSDGKRTAGITYWPDEPGNSDS